jgi:hypothetical protein
MRSLILTVLSTSLILAAAASADVEEKREMKIVVAGPMGDETTSIHWIGSGDSGFDMHGMQVGETRSIVDESGRTVLITREEEGFKLEVDGKTVVLPEIGAAGEYMTFVEGSDVTADFDVEIVGNHVATPVHGGNTVTIISDEPLDATTQESIKAVLQSAGRDETVTFIDGSGTSDGRHVKVIRKRVEIEQ